MFNLEQIVQQLSSLTVMEALDLTKKLEEVWGVSAAPVAMAAPAGGAVAAAPAEDEKTHFDIIIVDSGDKKINVIKEVRVIDSSISLMDAKALVEKLPAVVKKGATKEEATKFKALLEAAGAKVEVK